jgi:hypothetical protein
VAGSSSRRLPSRGRRLDAVDSFAARVAEETAFIGFANLALDEHLVRAAERGIVVSLAALGVPTGRRVTPRDRDLRRQGTRIERYSFGG